MNAQEARDLIREAVPPGGRAWADLGAGEGTFTQALAELLGSTARIHAIDRERRSLAALRKLAERLPNVEPRLADFTQPIEPPGEHAGRLDGLLLANSLHFVDDATSVLARLVRWLKPAGRLVVVEYDRRSASRWVPHPVPSASWPGLASAAGLARPAIVARRPSAFGGDLYVAIADRS